MPLTESPSPADPEWVKANANADYLIFFSSRDESGTPWCPYCVAAEDTVKKVFSPADGPSGVIIYVGQRAEWKTPSNPFRAEPWNVKGVPTIIRARDGVPLAGSINEELAAFVRE
ncbi:hypothetical protein C8Q79DRAFT_927357 [Trametes meyenii]|nr:hypothetical protein C8Q79DRAFT_927357 [Trametes meyenii]